MQVQIAKDPDEWNTIVDKSSFSVLHHRYELCSGDNALPLLIKEGSNRLLFPLRVIKLLGLKIATSPIYCHASLLPSDEESCDLIPEALNATVQFLRRININCLVTSVPTFVLEPYASTLRSWFNTREASRQIIYADMLPLKGKTFQEVWKNDFSMHVRKSVRRAEKEGVHVERVKDISKWVSDMVYCNVSSSKRQGRAIVYPHCNIVAFMEYLRNHKQRFGGHLQIYGAFFGNRLIAYMTTIEFHKLVIITLAMSRSEYLKKRANNALLAYIVKHTCEDRFEWVSYAFDRVSASNLELSLVSSLRRFKFDHGFREVPIPIYRLGLTYSGKVFSRLSHLPSYAFIGSAKLPMPMKRTLQYFYDFLASSQRSKLFVPFHL